MTTFLLVMLFSIFSTWEALVFNCDMETIELSKLADGEGENENEKSENDTDEKIKHNSLIAIKMENDFRIHSSKAYYIISAHTQEIVTPPPEFA